MHRLRRHRSALRCHVVHDRRTAAVRRRHDRLARIIVVHLRAPSPVATVPAMAPPPPEPLVVRAEVYRRASPLGDTAAAPVGDSVRVRATSAVARGKIGKVKVVVVAVFRWWAGQPYVDAAEEVGGADGAGDELSGGVEVVDVVDVVPGDGQLDGRDDDGCGDEV